MTHWRSPSTASRLLGVSMAVAVTIGLVAALTLRHWVVERHREPLGTTVFLRPFKSIPLPSTPKAAPAAQARPSATRRRESNARAVSVTPLPTQSADVAAQAPPLQAAEPQATPASAPLRTDVQTLQRAIAGTEGQVQRLARSSGNELHTRRPTQSESLSQAVAETAVPDCLAPNAGGSLLSAPIIAYMAVRGKCK